MARRLPLAPVLRTEDAMGTSTCFTPQTGSRTGSLPSLFQYKPVMYTVAQKSSSGAVTVHTAHPGRRLKGRGWEPCPPQLPTLTQPLAVCHPQNEHDRSGFAPLLGSDGTGGVKESDNVRAHCLV